MQHLLNAYGGGLHPAHCCFDGITITLSKPWCDVLWYTVSEPQLLSKRFHPLCAAQCMFWLMPSLYSGKLSRKKTCSNFEVLWLFVQVSSANFGGMASFGGTSEQFVKVFSVKILFSTKFIKNFSREFSTIWYRRGSHSYVACQSTCD